MSSSSSPSQPPQTTAATTTTTAGGPTTTVDYFKSATRQVPIKQPLNPSIYQSLYSHPTQPPFPPPPPPPPQQQQNRPPPNSRILYPVASSGRGLVPNSEGYPPRPASGYPHSYPAQRPYIGEYSTHSLHHLVNPHLQQTFGLVPPMGAGLSVSAAPKVAVQASTADDNRPKNKRDKHGDETFVMVRDRKVQVSEGTSLYALCRSWLKNGYTSENQPQYADSMKSLPKPLPASMVEAKKEDDTEIEEKIEDVEHLSAEELLQQHVKNAKKVRTRLRNQRLQRIERYKDRLALLLPPVVDQPKIDPTS
uniref:bromodomain-containing protein 4-like isoform X1 n=1 Tax=Erigeron canadensis TaxID=72917 RepID=UPI001CB969DF|nr:bromodomain-containing protein 4-like isoform X1 [Erigeron canadensis]